MGIPNVLLGRKEPFQDGVECDPLTVLLVRSLNLPTKVGLAQASPRASPGLAWASPGLAQGLAQLFLGLAQLFLGLAQLFLGLAQRISAHHFTCALVATKSRSWESPGTAQGQPRDSPGTAQG